MKKARGPTQKGQRTRAITRVGIFTKMEMAGGSEFRAVEMANAISRLDGYQSVLMSEKRIPEKIKAIIAEKVEIRGGIFSNQDVDALYSVDHLLVINTDSREFTTLEYWRGESNAHCCKVNLRRIRQMAFLFNFIVSPACKLPELQKKVSDIRIIAANSKFFDEISQQERYEAVRHYPRLQLESPIHPDVALPKMPSARVRLGMHSLSNPDKWNVQLPELIHRVNDHWGDQIVWDFMGIPKKLRGEIMDRNVILRPEFFLPVSEFLVGIDIFVFFVSWKREEAWARSTGEALMSGCPVVTTGRGGNRNQVIHGNTGFLCKNLEEFVSACGKLIENGTLRLAMQRNAKAFARNFTSERVVQKFLDFLQ